MSEVVGEYEASNKTFNMASQNLLCVCRWAAVEACIKRIKNS